MHKILLSPPHMSLKELDYVNKAILKGEVSTYGENIVEFEYELNRFLNNEYLATLNSGTAAIHLALIQLGVSAGDEVICQSFTFSASANPIVYQGATPVFVDSEPTTWNMCPDYLEKAIKDRVVKGKKPKAIIIVHLYGMPSKIDDILDIAERYNIPIIEDAAEALGSTYKKQKCGTFGHFGVLSFNGNKIITTSGGGALICNSKEEKEKAIFLSTQARDDAPHYQHSKIGYNYRMSNVSAGIGRGQMEVLNKHISLRRENNKFYEEIFKCINGIKVFKEPNLDFFSNYWLSCIHIKKEIAGFDREDLRLELSKNNIESRPLWKPMHLQPIFKESPFYGSNISEDLFNNGLCLPSGSNLTGDDKRRIKSVITNFVKDIQK